jgi:hypothetical protein
MIATPPAARARVGLWTSVHGELVPQASPKPVVAGEANPSVVCSATAGTAATPSAASANATARPHRLAIDAARRELIGSRASA